MFGQTTVGTGGISSDGSRVFRFEVMGLRQNEVNDLNNYEIRRSGSVFITVPYNRMSEEMQRISRMGGKIVNIEPLTMEVFVGEYSHHKTSAESALKPDTQG